MRLLPRSCIPVFSSPLTSPPVSRPFPQRCYEVIQFMAYMNQLSDSHIQLMWSVAAPVVGQANASTNVGAVSQSDVRANARADGVEGFGVDLLSSRRFPRKLLDN